jgi:hypothetical protein
MKAYGGADVWTHWMGGWLGPRTSLDDLEKTKFLTLLRLKL